MREQYRDQGVQRDELLWDPILLMVPLVPGVEKVNPRYIFYSVTIMDSIVFTINLQSLSETNVLVSIILPHIRHIHS